MPSPPPGHEKRSSGRKAMEEAIHAFYAALIRGDVEEFASYFAPDGRINVIGNPVLSPSAGLRIGRDSIARFLAGLHVENGYLGHHISDIIHEGDQIAVRWQVEVRFLASGRVSSFEMLDHMRLRDNLIVELTHYHDTGAMAIANGRIKIA